MQNVSDIHWFLILDPSSMQQEEAGIEIKEQLISKAVAPYQKY
jgi:hypothetical protein